MARNRPIALLLIVYAIASIVIAITLYLNLPNSGDLSGTTSGNILASAILALGFGAAVASRDPWEHRLVVQIIIGFTSLAAVAIVHRVFADHLRFPDPTWAVLAVSAACPVLLAAFYPRAPGA